MLGLIIFVSLSMVELISAQVVSLTCNNKSTTPDLRQQYLHWLGEEEFHPSLQLNPNIYKMIGLQDNYARPMRGNNTFSYGNRHCLRASKTKSEDLNDISLCPYYFLLNHDLERYPPTINTARCRCSDILPKCKHAHLKDGKSQRTCKHRCKTKSAASILTSKCTEVPYRYKVLKQKYDDNGNKVCDERNNYVYVKTYEIVAIACMPVYNTADKMSPDNKVRTED